MKNASEVISIKSLPEYIEYCMGLSDTCLFRGQSNSKWPLSSSLTRLLRIRPTSNFPGSAFNGYNEFYSSETKLLARFCKFLHEDSHPYYRNIANKLWLNLKNGNVEHLLLSFARQLVFDARDRTDDRAFPSDHGEGPYFEALDQLKVIGEVWSYGQHFGLPTPLLDWTTNALNACWFALSNSSTPPESPCVIAFDPNSLIVRTDELQCDIEIKARNVTSQYGSDYPEFLLACDLLDEDHESSELFGRLISIQSTAPRNAEQERGKAQDSVLLRLPTGYSLEEAIDSCGAWDHAFLARIDLSGLDRNTAIAQLGSLGVRAAKVFPGMEGIVKQCMTDILTNSLGEDRY